MGFNSAFKGLITYVLCVGWYRNQNFNVYVGWVEVGVLEGALGLVTS
jgi:hypothetical protein